MKTQVSHPLLVTSLVLLAGIFMILSFQNITSSKEVSSKQLDGYWTADSVSQFIDGQSQAFVTNTINKDDNRLRSVYYLYEPDKDCPLNIYTIQEYQTGFKIVRKDYAKLENDSIKSGPNCGNLLYKQGWILDDKGRIAISNTSETSGTMVYYYSRKDGAMANNIKKEILNKSVK